MPHLTDPRRMTQGATMIRRFFLAAIVAISALLPQVSFAQLSAAQRVVLKAAILAETDPTFVAMRLAVNETGMAAWYSADAAPLFTVWKTNVSLADVAANVDGVELVGLTTAKLAAYQSLLLAGAVNPSRDRLRAGFEQVFSAAGGATTRPLLLALWKRPATRIEKLFGTGTGTDAVPAYLVYEGRISPQEISDVIRS